MRRMRRSCLKPHTKLPCPSVVSLKFLGSIDVPKCGFFDSVWPRDWRNFAPNDRCIYEAVCPFKSYLCNQCQRDTYLKVEVSLRKA